MSKRTNSLHDMSYFTYDKAYYQESFKLPNPSLSGYFAGVRSGNERVVTTNFYEDRDFASVLNNWLSYLEAHLAPAWPEMYQFELDLSKKVGPMSTVPPLSERIDDIAHYYDDISLPSSPVMPEAIEAAVERFGVRGVKIRNQYDTWDRMKKNTNSGNPYFTKKRFVADDTLPIEWIIHDKFKNGKTVYGFQSGKWWNYCAILGHRGQEGGPTTDDVKHRVVFMFPFAINLAELQAYQPLIEAFQRHNAIPGWVSLDAVDRNMTKLFTAKASQDLVICTDFSKYDQHFNADMQAAAKSVISRCLYPDKTTLRWLDDVFPIKFMIPLCVGENLFCFGKHGQGSGSGGTSFDNTVGHSTLQEEAAIINSQKLTPGTTCNGDDGVISFKGISVEKIVAAYTMHGQETNPDKQHASPDDAIYLRRYYHKDYRPDGIMRGVYSTCRALGRLKYMERWHTRWGAKDQALRQLSILENLRWHPLRYQFAEYCMEGDAYRLGLDIPGFLDDLDRIVYEEEEQSYDLVGYNQQFLNPSRASDWWIVQYLKSKTK